MYLDDQVAPMALAFVSTEHGEIITKFNHLSKTKHEYQVRSLNILNIALSVYL